jgi:hypothetical protein
MAAVNAATPTNPTTAIDIHRFLARLVKLLIFELARPAEGVEPISS